MVSDLGHLATNPLALLVAAVIVLWIARTLANMAFKIVLVLAIVGAIAVAGGASLPDGTDMASLASGLQSSFKEAAVLGSSILQAEEKKLKQPGESVSQ